MSEELPAESQGKMIVFGARQIRRKWADEQWFFSVVDIIAALTDSDAPAKYWTAMKRREEKTSGFQFSTICRQLKLTSSDGKTYKTECVNTEAAFRVIQSIPSPKAEPFKRWLAEVGYQRVQEIENPELAQQRAVRSPAMLAANSKPGRVGESSQGTITSPTSPSPNCPPNRNNGMRIVSEGSDPNRPRGIWPKTVTPSSVPIGGG